MAGEVQRGVCDPRAESVLVIYPRFLGLGLAIAALANLARADNPFDQAMPPLTSPEVAQIQLDDGTLWHDPKAFRRLTYIPETRAARAELYAAALLSSISLIGQLFGVLGMPCRE